MTQGDARRGTGPTPAYGPAYGPAYDGLYGGQGAPQGASDGTPYGTPRGASQREEGMQGAQGAYGAGSYGSSDGAQGAYDSYGIPHQRATDGGPAAGRETAAVTAPEPAPVAVTAAETGAAAPAAAPKKAPGRDRYLDLLRSIALVRVVVYHLFGWAWLTVLFPSMGVMFALAGSLMARSLSRPAWGVIRSRVRRLLPPLWAFSAVVLALMFAGGWNPTKNTEDGPTWALLELVNYIIPIGAPPFPWHIGSKSGLLEDTWAVQAAGPLWYLRAYLWFVVASPLLLWAFRRVPWATVFAPLALTAVIGTGLVTIPGETGNAVTDFAVYGGCWMLGFAHQEGLLKQIPRYVAISCAGLVMAFGLWWASGHLGPDGWDLNDIPLAQATWSFGFVVILLQYSPSWQELPGRLAKWDKLVTLSNNRAVTIYLWHNMLIMATVPIIDPVYELPFMQSDRAVAALDSTYMIWMFCLVWPLIGLAVLAFGWIEDLAAKRKPRLWPNGSKRGSSSGPTPPSDGSTRGRGTSRRRRATV